MNTEIASIFSIEGLRFLQNTSYEEGYANALMSLKENDCQRCDGTK